MLFDTEFFIALLLFMISLVLAIEPPRTGGIINFTVGMSTIFTALVIATGFVGATETVEQVFMVLIGIIGAVCMMRASGLRK